MSTCDPFSSLFQTTFSSWTNRDKLQSVCLGLIVLPINSLFPWAEDLLTPNEKAKTSTMGPQRRKSFIASRAALKRLTRQLHLVDEQRPSQTIETLGTDNMRPCLADSSFYCSVAHSGPLVTAVAHDHPIGVDLERISEKAVRALHLFSSDREREMIFLSPLDSQRAATRIWTGKEAAAKALGLHLFQALREVELIELGEKEGLVRYQKRHYPVWFGEGEGMVISLITIQDH